MYKSLLLCCFVPCTLQVYTTEFLEQLPPVDFSHADAKSSDIIYYLFQSANQTTAITLDDNYIFSENAKKLATKVLMHGYTSNVTTPWYKEIKKEYLERGPHNIIYVDWSIAANKSFRVSAANIKPVGEFIAEFLINLRIPLENVHLIGHSLGSHLAGFIGRNVYLKTGEKVSRITATDAAGPGFEKSGPELRLCKSDATFVDVIHTDAGYYGIKKPIGHVDFYVNGGANQPGCPKKETNDNCSHARSNDYFIESINTENVLAREATFDTNGNVVPSVGEKSVLFGDAAPFDTEGIYYLRTNSQAPFFVFNKKLKRN